MTPEVLFGYMQDFSPFFFGFRDYLLSLHLNYHFPKIMLLQKNIVKKYLALLNKEQKFTLVQQDEWEDYFNQYRQACQELSEQIKATDAEIDNKVFDLYGLTSEEREIVMGK